jgi:regulator of protease activity HflC (stomatin/prohibitin superfamily)
MIQVRHALRKKKAVVSNLWVAIVRQYERGVVFRWGRVRPVREPGIRLWSRW